jgi:glycine oxidase
MAESINSKNEGGDLVPLPARRGGELDLLVVGAGIVGLAIAWRAGRAGLRVRVLERDRAGAGASGVAAGMLAPIGEASWGEEAVLALGLDSAAAWPAFAAELEEEASLAIGYSRPGSMHVAVDGDEAAELRRRHELMRAHGLEAEWLRPGQAREIEPGLAPGIAAAVHVPAEATVDPQAAVEALTVAVEATGGELREGSEAVEAIVEGTALRGVRTADNTIHRAPATVLATGCWSGAMGWLPARMRPPVRPVKGQVLTLQGPPEEPVCDGLVVTERVYLVPRADGRLIAGATVEEQGFDLRVTAGGVHELLREAYRVLPDVAELEFVAAQAGMRPATPDNAPIIGAGALDGLFMATGHYRNGVLQAPRTAEAVVSWACGDGVAAGLEPFAPDRFASAGAVL